MKIAVTGATGFLGRATCARLAQAHELVPISRGGTTVAGVGEATIDGVAADVTDLASLLAAFAGVDVVVHAAGRVSHDPVDAEEMWDVHVIGTENVLSAAREAGVKRVIHVSSSGAIAVSNDPDFLGTEDSPDPVSFVQTWPYYRAKRISDEAALAIDGLDVVVLNPTLLLGPGDTLDGAATRSVRMFLDEGVPVPPGGTIAFVDVRDVADAIAQALTRGQPGRRYLLNGANLSWQSFFSRVARISGKSAPIAPLPGRITRRVLRWLPELGKDGDLGLGGARLSREELELASHHWSCDSARANNELDWHARDPQRTLEDTVFDIQDRKSASAMQWGSFD
jgi:dihydroflavonol-4-reductase